MERGNTRRRQLLNTKFLLLRLGGNKLRKGFSERLSTTRSLSGRDKKQKSFRIYPKISPSSSS
jgi:hypothetical protein